MNELKNKKLTGQGDWIDDESLERIWDAACEWYEKNIDRLVDNVLQVYALTGNEVGYSALTQDWTFRRGWKGVGDNPQFSKQDIRDNIADKMFCPFNWLKQKNDYGDTSFNEGMTGLLVTFHLNVTKGDEYDGFKWSYSYNLSLNIGSGEHNVL